MHKKFPRPLMRNKKSNQVTHPEWRGKKKQQHKTLISTAIHILHNVKSRDEEKITKLELSEILQRNFKQYLAYL